MKTPLPLLLDRLQTPIGELVLVCDVEGRLRAVDWSDYKPRMLRLLALHYGMNGYALTPQRDPFELASAFARYFRGDTHALEALPTATAGTEFQREVWHALRAVPVGQTVSYSQLAGRIGRPRAVRAVGAANGANPVGLVVPCHRVVGANGSLTGYGGGMERKQWLLRHEHSP